MLTLKTRVVRFATKWILRIICEGKLISFYLEQSSWPFLKPGKVQALPTHYNIMRLCIQTQRSAASVNHYRQNPRNSWFRAGSKREKLTDSILSEGSSRCCRCQLKYRI